MGATNLLRKYLVTEAQTTRCLQASETLCRKGGTSRSDNAPRASGACAGAKLACGATLSATRELATSFILQNNFRRAPIPLRSVQSWANLTAIRAAAHG